mgnify:CR=1 FL=1
MYKYYWVQINPESQLSLRACAVGLVDLPAVIDRKVEKLYSFVWGFSSHSRIFHSYGDVTITGEGLQIFNRDHCLSCHTCAAFSTASTCDRLHTRPGFSKGGKILHNA